MNQKKMTDAEKKEILKNILGTKYHSAGKNFPIFSEMMDGLGTFNDVLSFVELVPVLNTWLSGSVVSAVVSRASIAGVFLFPFQQMINLLNANETGLQMYSYRSISYSLTAWAFNKPKPMSSPQIISNIRSGPYRSVKSIDEYHKVWRETSISLVNKIELVCLQKKINKDYLKVVFKALGHGSPEKLSVLILHGFESEFSPVTRHIWASNFSVVYPR